MRFFLWIIESLSIWDLVNSLGLSFPFHALRFTNILKLIEIDEMFFVYHAKPSINSWLHSKWEGVFVDKPFKYVFSHSPAKCFFFLCLLKSINYFLYATFSAKFREFIWFVAEITEFVLNTRILFKLKTFSLHRMTTKKNPFCTHYLVQEIINSNVLILPHSNVNWGTLGQAFNFWFSKKCWSKLLNWKP